MRSAIVQQFGKPTGLLGEVAGLIMAVRPSNRERNRRTLEFLQRSARPGDPVLSVGNCVLAYAPDPRVFDCIPPEGSERDMVTAALGRRPYRFMILPVSRPDLGPAGWRMVYADESFRVLTRGPEP